MIMPMDSKALDKLIRIGEGYAVEFKSSPSHLGRAICAFANAAGGRILIGVDDQGRRVGVKDPNRTISEIQTISRNIDPPLVLDIETADNILVVSVPSGPNKPYSANGLFYIREAANSQQMKRDQIREFFFTEGLIRFDEQPCKKFNMRRDFDREKYTAFCRLAGIPPNLRRDDVLRNLQVLTQEGMTNAGVFFFSRNIPKFFLQASLTCALFQGTTKTKILDQATFQGSIQENYNAVISYLVSHLNTEYVIKAGPREEILELPEEALREAVLNALGHRDYRSTSHVQVNIFLDRVEVWNPGGLVSGLRMKDLGRVSRPRNLLIFSLMARMDLVEHIGSGIKRIRESVAAHGLQAPLIEADGDWFSITFMRKTPHDTIERLRGKGEGFTPPLRDEIGAVSEGMDEGIKAVVDFIERTPGLRAPQISEALGVPVKTLERRLKRLKAKNRVEFRGSRRFGGYRRKEGCEGGVSGGVNEGVSEGMDEGIKAVVDFIERTPGLRAPQISEALGVPVKTLERRLKRLKAKNRVEFRGSRRFGGYWKT